MQSIFRQISRPSYARTLLATSARPKANPFAVSQLRTLITKKYTEEHEIVLYDSDTGVGTISITNHAQSSLGDVVYVELPSVGNQVTQGDQIGAVESVKAASDIYAPVSGEIKEVNEKLESQTNLLNKDPEGAGWLCKIQLSDPAELDKLLTLEDYEKISSD